MVVKKRQAIDAKPGSAKDTQRCEDEVLRRMLETPPKPRRAKAQQKLKKPTKAK